MRRRLFALASLTSGGLAATALCWRWFNANRECLDVYFDDGSFITFDARSPEAAPLLELARVVLHRSQPSPTRMVKQ